VVDEPSPHSSGCRPEDVRELGSALFADPLRSLTHDLDQLRQGKPQHLVAVEI
jgi:hypothetical protein